MNNSTNVLGLALVLFLVSVMVVVSFVYIRGWLGGVVNKLESELEVVEDEIYTDGDEFVGELRNGFELLCE